MTTIDHKYKLILTYLDGYLSFLDHAKGFVTDSWCIFHSWMANKMGLRFVQHSLVEVGAEGGQTKH